MSNRGVCMSTYQCFPVVVFYYILNKYYENKTTLRSDILLS